MSSATVASTVRHHLSEHWDESKAAIREPNTVFDPLNRPWIQLRFPGAAIERGDIGEPDAPLWDEVGAFMVDVYVPAGSGAETADRLADAVWDLFKGQEIEGIRFDSRLQGTSGPRTVSGIEGTWWGTSYGIAYRYLSVG